MKRLGLIGYPLSHSFSKGYFTKKFMDGQIHDHSYENFPLESIDQFQDLIKAEKELIGLNVTIPYKEQVIPFLDELDEEAQAIGAVNTIKVAEGKLKGFNTDIFGFVESLKPLIKNRQVNRALVLGTGGASKAVVHGLKQLDISFQYVSRSQKENCITYRTLSPDDIRNAQIIINTTPLGMYPKIDTCPPIAYGAISGEHILYDLVYNPETTLFLNRGLERGAVIKNGLEMLHLQAERAWEIWNS